MKIKLITDLPLLKDHGANKGREFDVVRVDISKVTGKQRYWFVSDVGEEVAALSGEFVECTPVICGDRAIDRFLE